MPLGGDVGIYYGRRGCNVPSPAAVVNFLTKDLSRSISLIRIPDADPEVLTALHGTNLVVTLGVPNEDVPSLALSKSNALNWVNLKLVRFRYGVRIRYITVGDGLIPGDSASSVLPAMKNLREALIFYRFSSEIFITTIVPMNALAESYPPSRGIFSPAVSETLKPIAEYLISIGSPIMIDVQPYYALVSEPGHIALDYALFRSTSPVVIDGPYKYYNLFDAMVDAFGTALARELGNKGPIRIVVGRTGWPTCGETPYACPENARVYNNKLKSHARGIGRTPRLEKINMEVYIYDMFDEDLVTDPSSRKFGMFYPNFTEVYPLWR